MSWGDVASLFNEDKDMEEVFINNCVFVMREMGYTLDEMMAMPSTTFDQVIYELDKYYRAQNQAFKGGKK